jgi:hypothetical protein
MSVAPEFMISIREYVGHMVGMQTYRYNTLRPTSQQNLLKESPPHDSLNGRSQVCNIKYQISPKEAATVYQGNTSVPSASML